MNLSEHKALRNKFLSQRQSKKKQTPEEIQKFLDNLAYRYYFMEKTLGTKLESKTKVSRLLAFEKMVRKDPSFTTKEQD